MQIDDIASRYNLVYDDSKGNYFERTNSTVQFTNQQKEDNGETDKVRKKK